jgi:hypothetical protein
MSPASPKNAGGRRARYGLQSAALVLAVSATCVLAGLIADRFPARWDVTATREHRLSQRTTDLLSGVSGKYEIVVAASLGEADPVAARRTSDVLDNFTRASPLIETTLIDISSQRGLEQLDAVMTRLLERYRGELDRQAMGLSSVLDDAAAIAGRLAGLSEALGRVGATVADGDPNAAALRRFLDDSGAVCRVAEQDLTRAMEQAKTRAAGSIGSTRVPGTEEAAALLRKPLSDTLAQLRQVVDGLGALAGAEDAAVRAGTREAAGEARRGADELRDALARAVTALDELPRTPLAGVARTLASRTCAIIVGPPGSARGGVTSVDVSSLLPPRGPDGGGVEQTRLDLRARTEELLAAGIASLERDDQPVVVIVHGEPMRLSPAFAPFARLVERLSLRGMDVAEWAAAMDEQEPALTAVNPGGRRPVVYATISTAGATPEGAARLVKLARAVRGLVEGGKPVLLSVNPSTLPAIGQTDPMVEFLTPLGVSADSGRPLMQQAVTAQGRSVSTDLLIADPQADQTVSRAVRGQTLRLPWAIPLRVKDGSGAQSVVRVDNQGRTVWAESEWIEYRRVPAGQRGMVANPPGPDATRDDPAGPWDVGVAIERGGQRLLVVGSNGWFLDDVSQGSALVDGREVALSPGNLELFEAGVFWLAGQDGQIGTSAVARGVPLIPPMGEGTMSAVRWALIGGMPLLVLLIGGVWRVVRG